MFPAPPEASDLALCGVRGAWSLPGWRPPISPSADGLYRDELASPNPSPEIGNVTLFGNGVVHAAEEASCTQQLPGSGQRPPGSLPPAGPVCPLTQHLGAAPLCLPHGVVFFALKPQLLRLWETSVGKLWGNFRPPDPNAMEAWRSPAPPRLQTSAAPPQGRPGHCGPWWTGSSVSLVPVKGAGRWELGDTTIWLQT